MSKEVHGLLDGAERNLTVLQCLLNQFDAPAEVAAPQLLRIWRDLALAERFLDDEESSASAQDGEPASSPEQTLERLLGAGLQLPELLPKSRLQEDLTSLGRIDAQGARADDVEVPWGRLYEHCVVVRRAIHLLRRRSLRTRVPRTRGTAALAAGTVLVALLCWGMARPAPWHVMQFSNPDLLGTPELVTATHALSYDSRNASAGPSARTSSYSLRYQTLLLLEEARMLQFQLESDDGSRLFVDDREVINMWRAQSTTLSKASLKLEAGTHRLRLEYFQAGGGAVLNLKIFFEDPGGALTPISASNLRPLAEGEE